MAIPCAEPTEVYAGDTAKWTLSPNDPILVGEGPQWSMLFTGPGIVQDYLVAGSGLMSDYPPSAGWTLNYIGKSHDGSNPSFTFSATSDTDGNYDISVDTTTWAAGMYLLIGYVINSSNERHVVRTSRLIVLQNVASTDPVDLRSIARQIYEQIKSDELRGAYVAEYSIGGRMCRYNTPGERLKALQFWAVQVAREEGKCPNFYGVSFSL
jgi:hypothetical protein